MACHVGKVPFPRPCPSHASSGEEWQDRQWPSKALCQSYWSHDHGSCWFPWGLLTLITEIFHSNFMPTRNNSKGAPALSKAFALGQSSMAAGVHLKPLFLLFLWWKFSDTEHCLLLFPGMGLLQANKQLKCRDFSTQPTEGESGCGASKDSLQKTNESSLSIFQCCFLAKMLFQWIHWSC